MHAVMQWKDKWGYVRCTPGPPREHWVVIWRRGDEDRLHVAFNRWASNPALSFSDRDSCRARQDILEVEWQLWSADVADVQEHRIRPWVEGICVGAFVVMVLAVVVRWLI